MPVNKVGDKWRWGENGKLYSNKRDALKQGKAILYSQGVFKMTEKDIIKEIDIFLEKAKIPGSSPFVCHSCKTNIHSSFGPPVKCPKCSSKSGFSRKSIFKSEDNGG